MKRIVTFSGARHRVSDADASLLQQALIANGARAVTVTLDGAPAFFNSDSISYITDDPDAPEVPADK